jgi:hypothetical protein
MQESRALKTDVSLIDRVKEISFNPAWKENLSQFEVDKAGKTPQTNWEKL